MIQKSDKFIKIKIIFDYNIYIIFVEIQKNKIFLFNFFNLEMLRFIILN